MTTSKHELRNKIDWEGWPSACEWFANDEFDDKRITEIVQEALDHSIALEALYDELEPLLGDEMDEDE